MKRIKYLICAMVAALILTSYSAMAADATVTDAYFEQSGAVVHTLSNGSLDCVINAANAGNNAVMINAVYEKNTDKLIGVHYVNAVGGEFKNTLTITDAQNTYVTMSIWDSLESANAKTQVYSIAVNDSAPENPWNVKINNKGTISFNWGASEDNLKTSGYRIYKNGEKIGETDQTSFTDADAKWYESKKAEYKLTAYDEYGNESDGKILSDVSTDNSDMAAILFSQPNITEKMSLFFATGKESDSSWYGYNTADVKDGVECRRIPADGRAVFKYTTEFKNRIGDGVRDAVIRVTYYDNNNDAFKISYIGKGARYTNVNITKNNTNMWITKEIQVDDFVSAYMDPKEGAKTQDERVDFTIWSKADSDKGDIIDTDTYISELQVVLEGDAPAEVTPEPTLAPGQTPAPTPTAAPTPTPTPTINPDNIKKASINFLKGQTVATCSESEYDLMRIFWAGKNNDEQISKNAWYGYNYGDTVNGEECRVIEDNKRLVLVYSDVLNTAIGNTPSEAKIRVRYLDRGTDRIRVSYISDAKRYEDLFIQKTNSDEWQWAEFEVSNLVKESSNKDNNNGGYQDGKIKDPAAIFPDGPNFTIYSRASGENESNNTTDYISQIEIILSEEDTPNLSNLTVTQDLENSTLSSISLSWTAIDGADGYNVYRDDTKLTQTPITETSYIDEDTLGDVLTWYDNYTYKIEAVNNAGEVLESGTAKCEVNKDNFGAVRILDGATYDTTYIGEKMTIYWGGSNQHVNNVDWWGYSEPAEIGGVKCRMIPKYREKVSEPGKWMDNGRISLRFNETLKTLIGSEPRNATIRVMYYDNGTDGIRLSYMSSNSRNTNIVIQKNDTNTWKWYELNVSDLVNQSPDGSNGLQDENTYLSVWGKSSKENNAEDTDTYIAEIQLKLTD